MFKGVVEHENGKRIKKIRTDNDEEYINNKIESIFFSMIGSREK
jgi:molybdopterin synthase catalytic subunit